MHTTIARGGTYGAIVTCMLVLATGCGGRDNDAATDSGVASAVPKTDSAERSSAGEVATADSNANLAGAADDRTAVRAVAMIHQSEIGAARMALTNAQNKDVKEFAQKMIDDHGKALSELRSVASKAGLPVPDSGRGYGEGGSKMRGDSARDTSHMRNMASPDTGLIANLRSDGRHMMEQLRGATGAGFDRAYMENMVSGHQNALNAVKQLSQSAQQQDVKKYLTDLVPKVQDHLERAQKVQKGLTGAS